MRAWIVLAAASLGLVIAGCAGHRAPAESEVVAGTNGEPSLESGSPTTGKPRPPTPYRYEAATLAAFNRLLATPAWSAAYRARNAQGMLEAVHETTELTFVLIPAGSFRMGSPEDEEGRGEDEGPVHTVRVPAFLMCKTECTTTGWVQGRWDIQLASAPLEDHPVVSVSWTKSREWCARSGLRLPGEAEWEYACRAGTRTRFSFGDADADLGRHAWYGESAEAWGRPVGKKRPNPWGLHDAHGNAAEWCEDVHGSYAEAPVDGSPRTTPASHPFRILRGGNRTRPAQSCRSASRARLDPNESSPLNGFRPAADLPK